MYKQLVVCSRGYGTFNFAEEVKVVGCPVCKSKKTLLIKNCGFVNSEWYIKGQMNSVKSMVSFEARTYDSKLYTFKELDYKSVWVNMTVICRKLTIEQCVLRNDSESYKPSEGSEVGSCSVNAEKRNHVRFTFAKTCLTFLLE